MYMERNGKRKLHVGRNIVDGNDHQSITERLTENPLDNGELTTGTARRESGDKSKVESTRITLGTTSVIWRLRWTSKILNKDSMNKPADDIIDLAEDDTQMRNTRRESHEEEDIEDKCPKRHWFKET